MSVESQWQSIYDQYESEDWFNEILFDPFQSEFNSPLGKYGQGRVSYSWEPDSPQGLFMRDWGGFFPEFDDRDWQSLDYTAAMQKKHLDEQTEFLVENREKEREREVKVLDKQNELAIRKAENNLQRTAEQQDLNKENLRLDALDKISQIDDMVAQTGISSGTNDRRKKIQLDTITSSVNQANYNKFMAAKDLKKVEDRAEQNKELSLNMSDAKYDAQYNTHLQDKSSKVKTIDLDLMLDKINVYDEWKFGQVKTMQRLFMEGVHLYDMDDEADKRMYVGDRLSDIASDHGYDSTRDYLNAHMEAKTLEYYQDVTTDDSGLSCTQLTDRNSPHFDAGGLHGAQVCRLAQDYYEQDKELGLTGVQYCESQGIEPTSSRCSMGNYYADLSPAGQRLYKQSRDGALGPQAEGLELGSWGPLANGSKIELMLYMQVKKLSGSQKILTQCMDV